MSPDITTSFSVWGLALAWGMAAAGIAWYVARIAMEITYVTLADGRRQERRLPILLRLLLPLTPSFGAFFRKPEFRRWREGVSRRLVQAGYEDVVRPDEFLALRVVSPLVLGTAAVVLLVFGIVMRGGADAALHPRATFTYLFLFLLAYLYPASWLKRTVATRHRSILRALPFVMDLLTLSVEAGLDFMAAIKTIIARRNPDPVGEELGRMLMEVQLGATRREAMRHLGDRISHPDVQSLMMALIQADEMGVSIGATLRIQADQIRMRRFQRAERLANEAPVKMLFPLVFFIFPAVFLVLLGPIVLQIVRHGL